MVGQVRRRGGKEVKRGADPLQGAAGRVGVGGVGWDGMGWDGNG